MNYKETEILTINIVETYCKGKWSEFYKRMHPEVVFLSIGKDQLVRGKKNVQELFKNRNESGIDYNVESVKCEAHLIDDKTCFTVLDSNIIVIYSGKRIDCVNQRLSVIWRYISGDELEKENVDEEGWYFMHVHISIAKEGEGTPQNMAHFSEMYLQDYIAFANQERKYIFSDAFDKIHRVAESQIMWIKGIKNGSLVQLKNEQFELCKKYLKDLEPELENDFLRIGKSYIVNISYVTMVKNCKAVLCDGSELPISKKNYSEIKKMIESKMKHVAEINRS